jgi:hypothetical protein
MMPSGFILIEKNSIKKYITHIRRIFKNMENKKVAVELITGEKLIGVIVEPTLDGEKVLEGLFGRNFSEEGIWLRRQRHFTYLSNDTIKTIRPALPFEKEIDSRN